MNLSKRNMEFKRKNELVQVEKCIGTYNKILIPWKKLKFPTFFQVRKTRFLFLQEISLT